VRLARFASAIVAIQQEPRRKAAALFLCDGIVAGNAMLCGMSKFVVNPTRLDPYKTFKFRVKFDGRIVAGVSKVSGLKRTSEPLLQRDDSDPGANREPGRQTKFEPITLERGVTHDSDFIDWATSAQQDNSVVGEAALNQSRKDLRIETYNEAGQIAEAYNVFRCWPSVCRASRSPDDAASAAAIEQITLENEGWERDMSVVEPSQG
jgi:phage tail-like protein